MAKRNGPSFETKLRVFMRDDFTCAYCLLKITNPSKITVDHVYPYSLGGDNTTKNLTTSCKKCNTDKRDLLLTQFLRAFEIKITKRLARFL